MFFLRLYQGQPTTTEIKHICQFFLKHPKARERLQQEDIQLLCKISKLNSHHTLAIEQDWNLFVQRFTFTDYHGQTVRFYQHNQAIYLCNDDGWNEVKRFQ